MSGDIWGLNGASEDELQPSSFARAAAARLALLFLLNSSISCMSDSVALVAAKVVARPLRLLVGGLSSHWFLFASLLWPFLFLLFGSGSTLFTEVGPTSSLGGMVVVVG